MNTYQECLKFFREDPRADLVYLLLSVVSIILAVYFYFKSRRVRRPIYTSRTINLIRENINKIESVEIHYSGERIQNLSISKLAFWNGGRETISRSDVAQTQPIRLKIKPDYDILEAKLLSQKNVANDFSIGLSEDKKSVLIDFEYVDYEEGIVLQVTHTGNQNLDLELSGSIKAVHHISRRNEAAILMLSPFIFTRLFRNLDRRKTIAAMTMIFGLLMLLTPIIESYRSGPRSDSYNYTIAFLGAMYLIFGSMMFKRRIPKGFDIYREEF